MTKREIKDFEKKLVEERAYGSFLNNFSQQHGNEMTITELYELPKRVIIYAAFTWANTPEGVKYWSEIEKIIRGKTNRKQ